MVYLPLHHTYKQKKSALIIKSVVAPDHQEHYYGISAQTHYKKIDTI